MNELYTAIDKALTRGEAAELLHLTEEALADGIDARRILDEALLPSMARIGEAFRCNDLYVPEVILAARAFNQCMDLLKPHFAGAVRYRHRALIGTVKGDLHDIGKTLVRMMLSAKGVDAIDIGVDADAETFVRTARENDCRVILISALLTTTMMYQKTVIDAFVKAGLRDSVRIIIGGAPVTQAFADVIGADAYGDDAYTSAELAARFLAEME